MANPIPFLLEAEGSFGRLSAHLARANPQLEDLAAVAECLVVFQAAQDYVTPAWYATKQETGKVVPTWNYATVHVWGRPRVVDDRLWLRDQIEKLTALKEEARSESWDVSDAPAEFIAGQIKGIVGLEIDITRTEGKWTVSQTRPEADRIGVVRGLREQGACSAHMAALVAERGGVAAP